MVLGLPLSIYLFVSLYVLFISLKRVLELRLCVAVFAALSTFSE